MNEIAAVAPFATVTSRMSGKNKRILWLLNHRTLMPYEAPLMRRLGFEVFTPKVIPKTNFRSAAIDHSYDESLTIPRAVLDKLNSFNFYEHAWTAEIVALVNRYFGTVFIIPHARQTLEAVLNFEGQIVFRAFGLDNDHSYKKVLEDLHGPLVMRIIHSIRHRFWFGQGYDHLHECEDPVFAERALYLPIGVPDSFFADANRWTGQGGRILFVCPFIGSNPYYTSIYKTFKEHFGDLPHVIVGAQDTPVDDPNVLGFVSDEELKRLYLESAVLYYPSTELRHVHYSPIEAAINGMPVVFFEHSLLSRMSDGATLGRVSSVAEARTAIERILAGDAPYIEALRADQRQIAYKFSDAFCGTTWEREMTLRGFTRSLESGNWPAHVLTEMRRWVMRPLAHGRTRIEPHRRAVRPVRTRLDAVQSRQSHGTSLYEGIRFSVDDYPAMVDYVDGVSGNEGWGRWSNGDKVTVALKHRMSGRFRIFLRAIAHGENANVPLTMRIGRQEQKFELSARLDRSPGTWLHFDLQRPASVIEIDIPHPGFALLDGRSLGIGLVELRAAPMVSLTMDQAGAELGSSLVDGLDFRVPAWPPCVETIEGVSEPEGWGRWSLGGQVRFELNHLLSGRVRLFVRAVAYGDNVGAVIRVTIGCASRSLKLPSALGPDEEVPLDFDIAEPSNRIAFIVPHPVHPPNDDRLIGIGFMRLRVERLT